MCAIVIKQQSRIRFWSNMLRNKDIYIVLIFLETMTFGMKSRNLLLWTVLNAADPHNESIQMISAKNDIRSKEDRIATLKPIIMKY